MLTHYPSIKRYGKRKRRQDPSSLGRPPLPTDRLLGTEENNERLKCPFIVSRATATDGCGILAPKLNVK